MTERTRALRVGDWVEVRSKAEILSTLDRNGQLNGLPFMPEMLAFCGKRFQVYKRAHKTCDTVFPVRGRQMDDAVHLETRCDGSSHGGCQASCIIFWKTAWLKRVGESEAKGNVERVREDAPSVGAASSEAQCSEANVWHRAQIERDGAPPVYVCQATRLPYATTNLNWWDVHQYVEDLRSGNVSLWRLMCGASYFLYYAISQAGIGLGPTMRWFYDKFHPLWRGTPFPRKAGTIPAGQPTPTEKLDLKPGEFVRVKSHDQILATLDAHNKNRGLYFDAEEVPYCGRTFRVLKSVTRIINENTGRMQEMKIPCVILDSVVCEGRYSECRLFCPRSIYPYWREIWLERV